MKRLVAAAVVCAAVVVARAQSAGEAAARAAAIRATIQTIEDECEHAAAGDWHRWYGQLAAFRANLRAKMVAAGAKPPLFELDSKTPWRLLPTARHPPLLQPPDHADYLVRDDNFDSWAETRPSLGTMIAISQWLKSQGIDLVVVPLPLIDEVYGDTMAAGVPPDHVVAPQLRRLLMELSKANVEVIDLLPRLIAERDTDPEPLFLYGDIHWSDRAQRIAADEITRRLDRYSFIQTSRARQPLFRLTPARMVYRGQLSGNLTDGDKAELEAVVSAVPVTKVTTAAGVPFVEPDNSPVLVIGDSFTFYWPLDVAKGSGIDALLSASINIPVSNVSSAAATIEPIKEFLRQPELLGGRKVIIWMLNDRGISMTDRWALPDLAHPSTAAIEGDVGAGWYAVEHDDGNNSWRWLEDEGELRLTIRREGWLTLSGDFAVVGAPRRVVTVAIAELPGADRHYMLTERWFVPFKTDPIHVVPGQYHLTVSADGPPHTMGPTDSRNVRMGIRNLTWNLAPTANSGSAPIR